MHHKMGRWLAVGKELKINDVDFKIHKFVMKSITTFYRICEINIARQNDLIISSLNSQLGGYISILLI